MADVKVTGGGFTLVTQVFWCIPLATWQAGQRKPTLVGWGSLGPIQRDGRELVILSDRRGTGRGILGLRNG